MIQMKRYQVNAIMMKYGMTPPHLDKILGSSVKKTDRLGSDKKRTESEHLHAFREDVYIDDNKAGMKSDIK